ncbi:MAG: ThiF family adenylyltransferase, partial [Spirochaetia bacterium]|nr:ThiF family adenylyltransferase [Spirochaetia bacterium]
TINVYNERITSDSIERIAGGSVLLIDCLDNIESRYIINDFALNKNIPIVHGGINGMAGQVSLIVPGKTPCLKCIFPVKTPKKIIPVLGATAGVIGSIQAVEAIKFLSGLTSSLENILLIFDGVSMSFDKIEISKNPACEACGSLK